MRLAELVATSKAVADTSGRLDKSKSELSISFMIVMWHPCIFSHK